MMSMWDDFKEFFSIIFSLDFLPYLVTVLIAAISLLISILALLQW